VHAVARGWLGFCALGAGLIHLALTIGSPLVLGMPLLLIGIAEFAWGVFALTAAKLPVPGVARIVAVIPLLLWAVALVVDARTTLPGMRVLPMLVAGALDLAIAFVITGMLRRGGAAEPRPLPPVRYLLALAGGAIVVAALTILALVATGALPTGPALDLPGHGH
jgi:hypothetical protein